MKALGFIEIESVTAAVTALDLMVKTAAVEFVTWERKMGGRLVTVIVSGDVSSVTAAIEAVKGGDTVKQVLASAVIARPHEEILKIIEISQKKLKN